MKNILCTEAFKKLWLEEIEAKTRLSNKLFCITLMVCNPVSSIAFYLAGDPFFYILLKAHAVTACIIIGLLILNHKKVITGQQMSFYTFAILLLTYSFLLSYPRLSYVQSCLNLTLAAIFGGMILRWPLRYALVCGIIGLVGFTGSIHFFSQISLSIFFEQGGIFVLFAYLLFPFVLSLSYRKDMNVFYFTYTLRQQNEALEKQKTIAENATRAKSDFLSMMSHEIRTPLNGIVGIVYLMMQEETNQKTPNELLNTLKFSSDHLMAVVNDVLDFNKINSNHVVLDPVSFDPVLLFENLRKTFVPRASEKGIDLIFDIDRRLPATLTADKVRLNQIITNLIHNAIKFTTSGYVKLVVTQMDKNVDYIDLNFQVIDTGIGIPGDEQETIFEIFMQAKPNVQRENGGTGLGLAISRELLRLFDSEIELKSEEGKGSMFAFRMKTSYSDQKEEESLVQTNMGVEKSYPQVRVLVADDNKTNLMFATMLLQKKSILFDTAMNGQEAFELFQKVHYDLVLMDLRMPVLDGFSSTALIRQVDQKIPIIALTASAFEDERERALASGFSGYLIKPFIPQDFYNYIFPFLGIEVSNAV